MRKVRVGRNISEEVSLAIVGEEECEVSSKSLEQEVGSAWQASNVGFFLVFARQFMRQINAFMFIIRNSLNLESFTNFASICGPQIEIGFAREQ